MHWNASMSCKAIVLKTAVIVFVAMIKVIAMKLVKFLIVKSLKLDYRYLISTICMHIFACRIFSANNYSNWNFEEWKVELSQIVNKAILIARYPVWTYVSAMQWWNIGYILCDRSFRWLSHRAQPISCLVEPIKTATFILTFYFCFFVCIISVISLYDELLLIRLLFSFCILSVFCGDIRRLVLL